MTIQVAGFFLWVLVSPAAAENVSTRVEALEYVHRQVLDGLHRAGRTDITQARLSAESQQAILRMMDHRDDWLARHLPDIGQWFVSTAVVWLVAWSKFRTSPTLSSRVLWASITAAAFAVPTGVGGFSGLWMTHPTAVNRFQGIIQREVAGNLERPRPAVPAPRGAIRWDESHVPAALDGDLHRTP